MADVMDDEVPAAPAESEAVEVDGTFGADLLSDVPGLMEPFPIGTFHFRLDHYASTQPEPNPEQIQKYGAMAKQPQFQLNWVCQQEPHTGRTFVDFVPWVTPEVVKAARAGDPIARELIRKRLPRAKVIMEAAAYKPTGEFDFKEFLGSNPELKIQLGIQEAKTKVGGVLKATGLMRNTAVQYVSLVRPR